MPGEVSWLAQIELVRSGKSDEIQVEQSALTDSDLSVLKDLSGLRTLLLDHPTGHFSAAGLLPLASLPNLQHLRIRGRGIDDEALGNISKLGGLRILNLPQATLTDAALERLKSLSQLELLRFGSPHVTDAGMNTIAQLPALKQLHLINVPITDAGLRTLSGIQQLQSLYLDGARISDAGVDELFRNRPHLHVHFNQQHHDRDPNQHAHP